MKIRIGTRGSKLALTQSSFVQDALKKNAIESEIIIIQTSGDKITDKPLYEIGGKALFVKELEEALLENRIDIAVHSMKDVPAFMPGDLVIAACLERADIRDVLISKKANTIESLPLNSLVGTCSVRRMLEIQHIRQDLRFAPLRGNVETRIRKLDDGNFDAIILAAAGLNRLGIWRDYSSIIPPEILIPAACQGAIGIQARQGDLDIMSALSQINHKSTFGYLQLERGFVEKVNGSCRTPLGCYSEIKDGKIHASFMLCSDDMLLRHKLHKIYDLSDIDILYSKGAEAGEELLECIKNV